MGGEKWTRQETLAAFALYCQLPFGKLHSRTSDVQRLAIALTRTPSSVAMKCCNLASLDDTHRERGVRGLQKVSRQDKEIWGEFVQDPDSLCFQAAQSLAEFMRTPILSASDDIPPSIQGAERVAIVKIRVNQRYFREMILASYCLNCAACGLPFSELLVAAHIVPWALDDGNRMNPRNGICLCGTHDLAFERGLLQIHSDFTLHVPPKVQSMSAIKSVHEWLCRYQGRVLSMPDRWQPDPDLLTRRLAMLTT